MPETILYVVLVVSSVLLGFIGGYLFREIRHLERTIFEQREQLKRKRHTYATDHALMDALGALGDVIFRERSQAEFRDARLRAASQILAQIRADPMGYDSDRPNNRPRPPDLDDEPSWDERLHWMAEEEP